MPRGPKEARSVVIMASPTSGVHFIARAPAGALAIELAAASAGIVKRDKP